MEITLGHKNLLDSRKLYYGTYNPIIFIFDPKK